MADQSSLGRLIAVHPIAPAALQRVVFIAVLSFLFFLGMMLAYVLRQEIGYFLLSTAFLVVYLGTMYSFIKGRKKTVELYEKGLFTAGRIVRWADITAVDEQGNIITSTGRPIMVPMSLYERTALLGRIRSAIKQPRVT